MAFCATAPHDCEGHAGSVVVVEGEDEEVKKIAAEVLTPAGGLDGTEEGTPGVDANEAEEDDTPGGATDVVGKEGKPLLDADSVVDRRSTEDALDTCPAVEDEAAGDVVVGRTLLDTATKLDGVLARPVEVAPTGEDEAKEMDSR